MTNKLSPETLRIDMGEETEKNLSFDDFIKLYPMKKANTIGFIDWSYLKTDNKKVNL